MSGDVIAEFIAAMEAAGLAPAEPVADRLGGELIRFQCEGDRKGRRNGWAILHLDGRPAGAFGSYRMGVSHRWRSGASGSLSREDRAKIAAERRETEAKRKAERDALHSQTAEHCRKRWTAANPVDGSHPYLVRKRVDGEGLRQENRDLLVPMMDARGVIWNLQAIGPDGAKRFAKGGRQQGLHLLIGQPSEAIAIGEGYATMGTVRRATGHAVIVAFSAANLREVALSVRERFPDLEIIIAADDDTHLLANPRIARNLGVEAAEDAARAVGGRVAMPPRGDRT